jgi:thiosulfate/3-mercaptopyruvate sulfurtransferase
MRATGGASKFRLHLFLDFRRRQAFPIFLHPLPKGTTDCQTVKVRKDQPGIVLIDARATDRYMGKHEPIDPIAGHIPGALNYPWQSVTDAAGRMLPIDAQKAQWTKLAPLDVLQEWIVYCGSGVTACVDLLSLHQLGISGKLYVGGWSDWCSEPEL